MKWLSIYFFFILLPSAFSRPVKLTEVKFSLNPLQTQVALTALKLSFNPVSQTIYFFDTEENHLFDRGLIIRARRTENRKFKITVKVRTTDEKKMRNLAKHYHLNVENDLTSKGRVISGTLEFNLRPELFEKIMRGDKKGLALFSDEQIKLLKELGAKDPKGIKLIPHGPIKALKWVSPKLTLEHWSFPDGKEVLEISKKVPVSEEMDAFSQLKNLLYEKALLIEEGQFKTSEALKSPSCSDWFLRPVSIR